MTTVADQPWFKFYAADYLLDPDVDAMPREAESLLVRMWCIAHREGSCPADPETLARKTLCDLQYVSQWKSRCEPFFELHNGKLYSRRMEAEKQRSETARKNANERWKLNPKSKSESKSESESERGNAIRIATRNANGIATSKSRPSLAEVITYCQERHNQVDPEKWFDYYSANGWRVGRNQMRDWKAAIRIWKKTESMEVERASAALYQNAIKTCSNALRRKFNDSRAVICASLQSVQPRWKPRASKRLEIRLG